MNELFQNSWLDKSLPRHRRESLWSAIGQMSKVDPADELAGYRQGAIRKEFADSFPPFLQAEASVRLQAAWDWIASHRAKLTEIGLWFQDGNGNEGMVNALADCVFGIVPEELSQLGFLGVVACTHERVHEGG